MNCLVLENMVFVVLYIIEIEVCKVFGLFLFMGDDVLKFVGVLFGGEKMWFLFVMFVVFLVNLLFFDELMNNFDFVLCEEIFGVFVYYEGVVVFVLYDFGVV